MVSFLVAWVVSLFVLTIGGGIGYWLWIKTRPKKETWQASIYTLGEGVREPIIKEGKSITNFKVNDLVPYGEDILEKVDKEPGITIYRLQKLNRTLPAVDTACVEYWGKNKKRVKILKKADSYTLLKSGYDKVAGEIIFTPLAHETYNQVIGQMAIRKDRLRKEKDILQAITPWIIAGICILGLVAMSYILSSAYVDMANQNNAAVQSSNRALLVNAEVLQNITIMTHEISSGGRAPIRQNLGVQTPPPEPPPLIEVI